MSDTIEKKSSPWGAMLPMLFGFFVMGFADIIGTVMNQVKPECNLSDTVAGFLPSMKFRVGQRQGGQPLIKRAVCPIKLAAFNWMVQHPIRDQTGVGFYRVAIPVSRRRHQRFGQTQHRQRGSQLDFHAPSPEVLNRMSPTCSSP